MNESVERYLSRCVEEASRGVNAVSVGLEGRLKLKGQWYDFDSTLRVEALSGFRWEARVRRGLVRFSGHDAYEGGHGEMIWKLYGLIPVVREDGEDVTHSARGRAAMEQVFLPSALARDAVEWSETPAGWAQACWTIDGEEMRVELNLTPEGELRAVQMQRWSDAEGTPWRHVTFGANVDGSYHGAGMRVPAKVEAGWFYGTERWEEGRFFEGRVTGLEVVG